MIGFNYLGRLGHLGNQMFQYSCLVSCAKKMGVEAVCPQSEKHRYFSKSRLSDCFVLGFAADGYVHPDSSIRYAESKFSFDDSVFNLDNRKDWDLSGYFQSEKYFKDNEDLIRSEFSFREEVLDKTSKCGIDPDGKVAIHVRRGDYLGLSDIHPTQSKSYYRNAMSMFPDKEFLIFSDDIKWCENADIFFGGSSKGFHFSKNDQMVDMCLMSRCTGGHIIANSTFSWWGAWLAKSEKVVAPKNWFGEKGHKDWQDIYCDGWIVI